MRYGPDSFTPGDLERLQRERLERERIEQLMHLGNALLGGARQRPAGLFDPQDLAPPAATVSAGYPQRGGGAYEGQPMGGASPFPFRHDNRNPDGTWTAPDATRDNIMGTSVDPEGPVWPRWKQTPPPHGEGEFVSGEPFFDIDEISQKAEFYPPGRPLVDFNVDGNPASRQRGNDLDSGNSWRRRLLVQRENPIQLDGALRDEATSNIGPVPIGLAPVPGQHTRPSSSSAASASSTFAGLIPGRARSGDAPSAVEPLNPELRERKRKEAIVAGGGGSFSVAPNPNANPNAPWYEHVVRSNVQDEGQQIEQVAREEGVDPDLIRAVMFMETTHGNYGGAGPIADRLNWSDTILPMNVNVRYWGDNFGTRKELNQLPNNIRAGARMLKNIMGNFQSPASIATIGTLYNDSNATRVSDYGARLEAIYKSRPWERDPDFVDDLLAQQPF